MSNTARLREFRLPDVGEGLTEAEILKWYVQPGDAVHDGMVVCEVETAKAAVELPIPYDGVVQEIRFAEGDTVDVGTPIIAVDTEPGAVEPGAAPGPGGTEAPADGTARAGAGSAKPTAGTEGVSGGDAAGPAPAAQPGEPGAESGGTKREPVLVGYGVAQSSTKRRPRKPQPGAEASVAAAAIQGELNGQAAPQPAPQAPGGPVGTGTAAPAAGHGASAPSGATAAGGITDMPGAHGSTAEPGAPAAAAPAAAPAVPAAGGPAGGRVLAKPPVRKLAKDLGVDLAAVVPTGDGGVITRDDVHAAAAPAPAAPAQPVPAAEPAAHPAPAAEPAATARETRIPIKGVRKATAQAMVASAFTAPHVTEFVTVDVTRTMKLVRELKEDPDLAGLRINPLLIVAKALLLAIRRNPEVNSAWDEDRQEIVRRHYVNLGIAAATPRGLIVPNIKDAHARSLPELATELAGLVATAREGRTTPEAMQNGSVTITNVGVFGIDTGTPILNPGEPAILAFGAIKLQPWVHKGKVKPRHVTTLALSFDHRLVDGELGSKVLADVAAVLERPKRLLTWG
ncbi:2-oxo acid dehydrogenase subunit E2 [Streptomyces sp. NBC_01808]|uniref:dihydrolipoamide acetyltransferase family protein n=1 Tax=Streptomyces sp. NBC_01808 TaxID=2975947 RepID=UPI002DD7A1A7|nr:dihydrolipoamide acetyltransferase family protein [Streptomyces sp. NBC_01808]WSA42521.1 2-oxo acid dehydrogenase subunit E2 [Streptomyces sp. NBC_01808]